jgi:hypothetical protein
VGLCISVVGAGLGLFQAAAFTRMMNSVPAGKLATASGALSLAQAFGTVSSVATIGGVFALSNDYHLAQLANQELPVEAVEGMAFIMAFQDVFRLGTAIIVLATVVFWVGRSKQSD